MVRFGAILKYLECGYGAVRCHLEIYRYVLNAMYGAVRSDLELS